MKILMFSGSLRTGSLNKKLIHVSHKILSENSAFDLTVVDLKTLNMPVYDGDIETAGMPEGVKKLGDLIAKADALIISSPEYNQSIAGSFKNTIDWVSRLRPVPLEGKPILMMGASPGYFGAIRALGVARAPLETLGCFVFPQTMALPKAGEAFKEDGDLVDEGTKKRLTALMTSFIGFAQKFPQGK